MDNKGSKKMKAELVKRQDRWDLYGKDGSKIASSAPNPIGKLSIKNCESIANGYDVFELAYDSSKEFLIESTHSPSFTFGYEQGFQKALALLGDKKFSELDMRIAYDAGCNNIDADDNIDFQDTINSLQQTEFDVEIVTELAYCKKGESGCKVYDQTKNSKDVFNLIYHCDGQIEGRFIHREPTGLKPTCVGYSKPMLDKDDCLILKRI